MNRLIALSVVAVLILASVLVPVSAEDAPLQEDIFRPVSEIGAIFDGSMTAEGQAKVQAAVRFAGSTYDFDFFAHTDYRQQTMQTGDFGQALSAVQFFNKADYVANRMNQKVEMTPDLGDRKVFIRFGMPPTVKPKPLNSVGLSMASLSFDDPFAPLLPNKAIRKDLEWDPNVSTVDILIGRMSALMGELPKKETDGKDKDDSTKMERGGGPGGGRWGDWANNVPRSLTCKVVKAWGRITDFTMKDFSGEVGFEAVLNMPANWNVQVEIPATGHIEFTYSFVDKGILKGTMIIDSVYDGTIEAGDMKIPVKTDWHQKLELERKYAPKYAKAVTIDVPGQVFDSPGPFSPQLAAYTDGGKVYLAQNWDGTEAWEGLNRCLPIEGLKEGPVVAGNSACFQYMIVTDGEKVFWSDDCGQSFTAITWRGDPIVRIDFLNSPDAIALLQLANGDYVTVDARSKALKSKKIVAPTAGKKLFAACAGGPLGTLFRCDPDDVWMQEGDGKGKKSGHGDLKSVDWVRRAPRGAYAMKANALYSVTSAGAVKVEIPNLPQGIVSATESDKEIFLLAGGQIYRAPVAGGEAASFRQEVSSMSLHFGVLFAAGPKGVAFAVRIPVTPAVKNDPEKKVEN